MNPLFITDAYKLDHRRQYPEGTSWVYSNFTPRGSRMPGISHMVMFGLQYFLQKYLIGEYNREFFERPKRIVMAEYERIVKNYVGGLASYDHIAALHDLGYLPIQIKALPEGTRVPMRVPCLTIENTNKDFFWLTNYLETHLSNTLWLPCTSATIADAYRIFLDAEAKETGMPDWFPAWQGHDFSCRGMSSPESAILSGLGHLTSFYGSDTLPALIAAETYYGADSDKTVTAGSVAATEHSVMAAGGEDNELETISRILDLYSKGIVSIVSDTYNFWNVITSTLPALKDKIMSRQGRAVVRPDSGDPVKIICGDPESEDPTIRAGALESLYNRFGGVQNAQGYKVLDSHLGLIYGDSITLDRAKEIGRRLKEKGFASQVVYGIGSFSYQMNTRDTFGTAMKATAVVINGKAKAIYKNPVTDNGLKKSARGKLAVVQNGRELELIENPNFEVMPHGDLLQTVFHDGKITKRTTLDEVRTRLHPAWELTKLTK